MVVCQRCAWWECEASNCVTDFPSSVGDGYCDTMNNVESCSWDGGDCCESTCKSGGLYLCGISGFACSNPNAFESAGPSCLNTPSNILGDGFCESTANVAACSWDGGDCCYSTCVSTTTHECGDAGFVCDDPDASDYGMGCRAVDATWIGDGFCDFAANTVACDWDGGDCCEATCTLSECGANGYICLDPSISEERTCGYSSWGGDGYCDGSGNTAACAWDSGDCCESTCVSSSYACDSNGYSCQDPKAEDYMMVVTTSGVGSSSIAISSSNVRATGKPENSNKKTTFRKPV